MKDPHNSSILFTFPVLFVFTFTCSRYTNIILWPVSISTQQFPVISIFNCIWCPPAFLVLYFGCISFISSVSRKGSWASVLWILPCLLCIFTVTLFHIISLDNSFFYSYYCTQSLLLYITADSVRPLCYFLPLHVTCLFSLDTWSGLTRP